MTQNVGQQIAQGLADAGITEGMRQVIAAGTRILVDQHELGPVNGPGRGVEDQAVTIGPAGQVFPAEHLDDVVGRLPARIRALVDDQRFLVELGKEHAVEVGVSGIRRVRQAR